MYNLLKTCICIQRRYLKGQPKHQLSFSKTPVITVEQILLCLFAHGEICPAAVTQEPCSGMQHGWLREELEALRPLWSKPQAM